MISSGSTASSSQSQNFTKFATAKPTSNSPFANAPKVLPSPGFNGGASPSLLTTFSTPVSKKPSLREALVEYYLSIGDKSASNEKIDKALEKYKGKEREMIAILEKKYNVPFVPFDDSCLANTGSLVSPTLTGFGQAKPVSSSPFASPSTTTTSSPFKTPFSSTAVVPPPVAGSGFSSQSVAAPGFGQPSTIGSGFAQASTVGSGFGQASTVGSGFGQASTVGSGFGQASTGFGQSSAPLSQFGSGFGSSQAQQSIFSSNVPGEVLQQPSFGGIASQSGVSTGIFGTQAQRQQPNSNSLFSGGTSTSFGSGWGQQS
jgi:hypothetical protein